MFMIKLRRIHSAYSFYHPELNYMKFFVLLNILTIMAFTSNAQTNKGTLLMGGDINLSSTRTKIRDTITTESTSEITLKGFLGYFPVDRFVIGINPSMDYSINKKVSVNAIIFGIGPFFRYYFLNPEKRYNLFAGAGYTFRRISGGVRVTRYNEYSISGGMVFYFNTAVGLAFTTDYSIIKVEGAGGKMKNLIFDIGFQFYLEKK